MSVKLNGKGLASTLSKNIHSITYDGNLCDEELTRKIFENSSCKYITYSECYGIIFDDNTFTIAYNYVRGVPSGIHRLHQIILEDLVSGFCFGLYSQGSFETQAKPYPIWVTNVEGVIEYPSCGEKKNCYFINLNNLICFDEFEDSEISSASLVNPVIIKEIIEVANAYLKKHPLFVEQAVLKRVKKKIEF